MENTTGLCVLWVILLLGCVISSESKYIRYNTTTTIDPAKINVHLVPHTHDDVGWLKTIDQYYVGSNNSIQAFFQRWWREQSDDIRNIVKGLVKSGQLEFINGGFCMHDEAATHYIDMIDQTTLGHQFLKEEFGVTPRIGWQIDPFGHSAVQAYLLGAEVGFDSLFFARIDYQDRAKRKDEKTLEVVWRGSKSFGSSSQIFSGAFPENYEPPSNFYYEVNDDSPIVQDDVNLFDYNVPERVNEFVAAAISQANITRTNHIMWTMGTDFKYQYAQSWFRQMDKFIHYVNQDGRVHALYSTPSIYTDAKHATNEAWPIKTDDYFPYADRVNAYWTGYFTSRPALKGYVRLISGYYLAARQLEYFKGKSALGPNTDSLAEALAIAQHHDAVSGTEKQHVANDYAKRLSIGYTEAEKVVAESLACLTEGATKTGCKNPQIKFQQCPLLNISYCPASEVDFSNGKNLEVVVYNPLGWKREDIIRIPVVNENVGVLDSSGKRVQSQLVPIPDFFHGLRNYHTMAYLGVSPTVKPKYWLAFPATVPPLGFSTYYVSYAKNEATISDRHVVHKSKNESDIITVGPENLKLTYSVKERKLTDYINSRSKVEEALEQAYKFYAGKGVDKDETVPQASGAYIFRPDGSPFPINSKRKKSPLIVFRGPIVHEVHQQIDSWIYQTTRLYKGKEHAEVEFIVGPIPIDDGVGKEIATEIKTNLASSKTFYTDSNGRDFIERVRDYRKDWHLEVNQPVAGNYYPINLGIYLKDKRKEFSILVDRAVGGSSIMDGQLELMVHRRLLEDDSRGVAEALNETVCIRNTCTGLTVLGKYYFRIDPVGEGARWRRSFGQEIYSPLLLAFSESDAHRGESHVTTFSGIDSSYNLPDNVAIITLQDLGDDKVLLRLAHLYEIEEDKHLSVKATVELKKVFSSKQIKKITEVSLSANQERAEMERKRLVWQVKGSPRESKVRRGGPVNPENQIVELAPMEIRTFVISFRP
ncbi:probable alpha-mannosidase At5g13980 isoform X2 [Vigna umbellata]|uniref:probable alpha-mannosidase At5g13980 isoform X2 n=1 Tax=Vigna umbellata TaxID=87088 RepID=UPI001F5F8F0D|nr:probable alpha-mannosidase At5g13980 isoform X2 [Vigna umbellata]